MKSQLTNEEVTGSVRWELFERMADEQLTVLSRFKWLEGWIDDLRELSTTAISSAMHCHTRWAGRAFVPVVPLWDLPRPQIEEYLGRIRIPRKRLALTRDGLRQFIAPCGTPRKPYYLLNVSLEDGEGDRRLVSPVSGKFPGRVRRYLFGSEIVALAMHCSPDRLLKYGLWAGLTAHPAVSKNNEDEMAYGRLVFDQTDDSLVCDHAVPDGVDEMVWPTCLRSIVVTPGQVVRLAAAGR